MSSKYEAPQEVRELERQIRDFSFRHGLNTSNVLHDLLLYIIHNFSLPDTPTIKHWPYTPEQIRAFYEMFTAWVEIMKRQIARHGFYDAFGDLFMALNPQRELQRQGQFLTPEEIADLCQRIVSDHGRKVNALYDPAAGSGRMLIASRTYHPRSYLVGWDIDYTCCLMCVCNFLINSCVGEVACINTISMGDFRGAWLVNEAYYRTGCPPSAGWTSRSTPVITWQISLRTSSFSTAKAMTTTSGGARRGCKFRPCAGTGHDRRQTRPRRRPQGTKQKRTILKT